MLNHTLTDKGHRCLVKCLLPNPNVKAWLCNICLVNGIIISILRGQWDQGFVVKLVHLPSHIRAETQWEGAAKPSLRGSGNSSEPGSADLRVYPICHLKRSASVYANVLTPLPLHLTFAKDSSKICLFLHTHNSDDVGQL